MGREYDMSWGGGYGSCDNGVDRVMIFMFLVY